MKILAVDAEMTSSGRVFQGSITRCKKFLHTTVFAAGLTSLSRCPRSVLVALVREEGLGAHPIEVVHIFVCLYKVGSQSPYCKGFHV